MGTCLLPLPMISACLALSVQQVAIIGGTIHRNGMESMTTKRCKKNYEASKKKLYGSDGRCAPAPARVYAVLVETLIQQKRRPWAVAGGWAEDPRGWHPSTPRSPGQAAAACLASPVVSCRQGCKCYCRRQGPYPPTSPRPASRGEPAAARAPGHVRMHAVYGALLSSSPIHRHRHVRKPLESSPCPWHEVDRFPGHLPSLTSHHRPTTRRSSAPVTWLSFPPG